VQGEFASGLFNLAAAGATSWYGFAKAILGEAQRHGLLSAQHRPRLKPVPSAEYPAAAARPKNSRLAQRRLSERFGLALPAWQQALSLCLADMKTRGQGGD